jgi:sulfofructose kinase
VLVDLVGERSIYAYRGEGLGTDPAWLPLHLLDEARAFLCDPRWLEGSARALDYARAKGLPTVIDGEKSETRLLLDLVPAGGPRHLLRPGSREFRAGRTAGGCAAEGA